MKIKAKEFQKREDLENHIVSRYGKSVDDKGHTIVGTTEELSTLHTRHGQKIWGILVQATDYKPIKRKIHAPRGESHSKINGQQASIKKRK